MASDMDSTTAATRPEAESVCIGQKRREQSPGLSCPSSPAKRANLSPAEELAPSESDYLQEDKERSLLSSRDDLDQDDKDPNASPGSSSHSRSRSPSPGIHYPPPHKPDPFTGRPSVYGQFVPFLPITKASPEEKKRFTDPFLFGGEDPDGKWAGMKFKFGGGAIAWLWPSLQETIQKIALCAFPHVLPRDSFDEAAAAMAKFISPDWEKFISSDDSLIALPFSMGWVNRILYDNLFSRECQDKWKDGPWQLFAKIQQGIRDRVTIEPTEFNDHYYSARYATARMLYALYGDHSDRERLIELLQSQLRPFIQNAPDSKQDLILELLDDIAAQAIKIDLLFVSSQNEFRIQMHDPKTKKRHSFLVDPATMKSCGRALNSWEYVEDFQVEIICAPRIRMMGISDSLPGNGDRVSSRGYCSYQFRLEVAVDNFPEPCELEHWHIVYQKMTSKLEAYEAARLAAKEKGEDPDTVKRLTRADADAVMAEAKATYTGPFRFDTLNSEASPETTTKGDDGRASGDKVHPEGNVEGSSLATRQDLDSDEGSDKDRGTGGTAAALEFSSGNVKDGVVDDDSSTSDDDTANEDGIGVGVEAADEDGTAIGDSMADVASNDNRE